MARDKFETIVDVDANGIPTTYLRDKMMAFYKQFPGVRLRLRVWKGRSPRSNKYYWLCCGMIAKETGQLTKEHVSDMLLQYFFSEEYVNEKTGTVFKSHPQLSDLSQEEQSELIDKMKILAASEWNVYLPEPGEQFQAEF